MIRKQLDLIAAWAACILWSLNVVALYILGGELIGPLDGRYTLYWGGALCAVGAVLLVSAIVQTLGYTTRELIAVKYTVAISVLVFECVVSSGFFTSYIGAFHKGDLTGFFVPFYLIGIVALCAEWHFCRARKLTVRSGWNSVGNAAPWMMVCLYLYPLYLSTALIFLDGAAPRGFLLTSIGIFCVMAFTVCMVILQRKGSKNALKIRYAGNFLVDLLFAIGWLAIWIFVIGMPVLDIALLAVTLSVTVAAFHVFCLYAERKAVAVVQE